MNKITYLILSTIFLFSCTSKEMKVKKIIEDGVEVIINHLEPYSIKGEPSLLTLKKEQSIDFASDEIGNMGIANSIDFEIDSEGNLLQKIRKEYKPISVTDEYIQDTKKKYEEYGMKVWFPKSWLPMGDFFLDDKGRFYVKTFEKGTNPNEYFFDIFSAEGVFIAKKAMDIYTLAEAYVCAKSRREHLYCFQEKPDGFREFQVYKMNWEYP